jgi:SAM-dependent methyltransferase
MANSEFIGAHKMILDVCCGTRAFWFNKQDGRVIFHDKRNGEYPVKPDKGHPARNLVVSPDVVGDFTALQFSDDTFALVVFDPPHATFGKSSVMAKTYGTLRGVNWRESLRKGFAECFRVLRPHGVLVFKWGEWEIPVRDVLALTPEKPLFGHLSGRRAQTHWVCFMKSAQNTMEICHTAPNSGSTP